MKKKLKGGRPALCTQAGFTLLELLVVIAIIGILTAVILSSVTAARNKATNKAIQENLITIRTQSNIYYDTTGAGTYGAATPIPPTGSNCSVGMFASDPTISAAVIKLQSYINPNNIACTSTGKAFAAAAQLTNQDYYCIDSTSAGRINTGRGGLYDISGTDATAAINVITSLCH